MWFLIKNLASGNDEVCLQVGFEFFLGSKFGEAKSDLLHLLRPGSQNNYHIRINNILEVTFINVEVTFINVEVTFINVESHL